MTRWFYTGARRPLDGLEPIEEASVILDVRAHVKPGDEVGQGGCDGVDEVVARESKRIDAKVTTFRPTKPRAKNHESDWPECREDVVMVDGDELARNLAGVAWAEKVRALPMNAFRLDQNGRITALAGSGTAHAARHAELAGKLDGWRSLRG